MIVHEANGHVLYGNKTPKGIDYLEYGNIGDPLIVYLHGIGEVGKSPSAILGQSPIGAGWANNQWSGFRYPDFFTKGFRVVAPILKSGSWTPAYIDSFLDEINTTNIICLMGWSWGGEGTANYMNQSTKKYDFKCGVIMCKSGSASGINVTSPVKLVHAVNDSKTSVSNSDKFYNGLPEQFKAEYHRPASGDHWVWAKFLEPSTGIYEWIKSFSEIQPPIEPTAPINNPLLSLNLTTGVLTVNGTHSIQTQKL